MTQSSVSNLSNLRKIGLLIDPFTSTLCCVRTRLLPHPTNTPTNHQTMALEGSSLGATPLGLVDDAVDDAYDFLTQEVDLNFV